MCLLRSPLEHPTGLGMGSHLPAAVCNRAERSQALPSSFSFTGFKTGFSPPQPEEPSPVQISSLPQ